MRDPTRLELLQLIARLRRERDHWKERSRFNEDRFRRLRARLTEQETERKEAS